MTPSIKTAVALVTGFGVRDFVKRHKKWGWLIIAVVVANEIRGLAVAYAGARAVLVPMLKQAGVM